MAAAPAPAPAAMDAAALAALGNAIGNAIRHGNQGQGKKAPTFETGKATDWKNWRSRFETIRQIAGWNDLRSRRELHAAMSGTAASLVHDIEIEDTVPPAAARTFDQVIAAYEERFVPVAATVQAENDFDTAQQMADETLLEWHVRLRELYLRANPGADIDQGPGGKSLRRKFVAGIDNSEIRVYVRQHRPDTFQECLTIAQRQHAAMKEEQTDKKDRRRTHKDAQIVALHKTSTNDQGNCYYCGKSGHFLNSCPVLGRARSTPQRSKLQASRKGGNGERNSKKGGNNRNSLWKRRSSVHRKLQALGLTGSLEDLDDLPEATSGMTSREDSNGIDMEKGNERD